MGEERKHERILAIDYGTKKCGLAATDVLGIAVHPIDTIATEQLRVWLNTYLNTEPVSAIVIGRPSHPDGNLMYFDDEILALKRFLEQKFPAKQILLHDETFSSAKAKEIIFLSGAKKKKRQDKKLIDKIAAVVILQDYLKHY
jgi:putative Holliday junction resolvase